MQFDGIDLQDVVFTALCYWTILSIINRLGYIPSAWAMVGGIAVSGLLLGWIGRTPWRADHAITIVVTVIVLWVLTLLVRGARLLLQRRP